LYASPDNIRVIKSRRIRWAEHVACVVEMRNVYTVLVGKSDGKRPRGRLVVDGRIIFEWMLGK
jgi:hypothetical protein